VNILKVDGDAEQLTSFKEAVAGDDTDLSFDKLVPVPQQLLSVSVPVTMVSEEQYAKRKTATGGSRLPITKRIAADYQKRFGAHNWFDWCLQNWGVKWDVTATLKVDRKNYLEYWFESASQAPLPWLRTVARRFPSLRFRLLSEHEENLR
jgi:hypothetical protein